MESSQEELDDDDDYSGGLMMLSKMARATLIYFSIEIEMKKKITFLIISVCL